LKLSKNTKLYIKKHIFVSLLMTLLKLSIKYSSNLNLLKDINIIFNNDNLTKPLNILSVVIIYMQITQKFKNKIKKIT